ncbi:MAG: hypothetical protein AABX33_05890 [Nanoarchaeota archaeon]
MKLIDRLKQSLPFKVYFRRDALKELQKEGKNIRKGQKYKVEDVYDSGPFGGIICAIPFESEALVISLTHLAVDESHPLSAEVKNYQQQRIKMLKEESNFFMAG